MRGPGEPGYASADKDAVLAAARADERVQKRLKGEQIVKAIYVPGRLVDFVVR